MRYNIGTYKFIHLTLLINIFGAITLYLVLLGGGWDTSVNKPGAWMSAIKGDRHQTTDSINNYIVC